MTDETNTADPITIVGAGMAGAACARALVDAGLDVRVLDRGRAPGGRMSSPVLHGRRVDLGAGYFTVKDPDFTRVVDGWAAADLARPWTDTFGVLSPGASPSTKAGPVRWGTPGGLRSLVRNLLEGIEVTGATELDELPEGHVVLAMPDPQAARITDVPDPVEYLPVISVACEFETLEAPFRDAAFVNDHPDIDFLVDDGARRGDGGRVLVVHSTPDRARMHLNDPDGAIEPVLDALRELSISGAAPLWTHAQRWTFAKPAAQHDSSFHLGETEGRLLGFAGDQWCDSGTPRVESAWRSGTNVARALIERLSD